MADLTAACESGETTACTELSSEDIAKQKWLNKLDLPAWASAAKAVSDIVEVASMGSAEESAKATWLARLDSHEWGAAAKGVTAVVEEAAKMADLTAACNSGVDTACNALSKEEEAKRLWLSKLDVQTWGKVAAAVSEVAVVATVTQNMDEEAAKAAWIAKLDEGRYNGPPSSNRSPGVGRVVPTAATAAPVTPVAPVVGGFVENSAEDEAKSAWLNRLDTPAWGMAPRGGGAHAGSADARRQAREAAPVVAESAADALPAGTSAEEQAKLRWLSRLDVPDFKSGAGNGASSTKPPVSASVVTNLEQDAKAKWLSRLDIPTWGKAATTLAEVAADGAAISALTAECASGIDAACETLSTEDAARKSWLAKLDVPSWGAAAKAVSDIVEVVASDEASAKAAWLSRLDAPTWGAAAQGVSAVVEEAAKMAHLTEECNSGVNTACEMLSAEDQAKKVWLAKLDVPTWAKVSSAVMEVADVAAATVTMNESDAKAAWLAKLDDGRYQVPSKDFTSAMHAPTSTVAAADDFISDTMSGMVVPTASFSTEVKSSLTAARQRSEEAINELEQMVGVIKNIKELMAK